MQLVIQNRRCLSHDSIDSLYRYLGCHSCLIHTDTIYFSVHQQLQAFSPGCIFITIKNDCVRTNPFNFVLNKVLQDDRDENNMLTPEQEESLIAYAQSSPVYQKYADKLIILLETGLRISEVCGLTINLDFANYKIRDSRRRC